MRPLLAVMSFLLVCGARGQSLGGAVGSTGSRGGGGLLIGGAVGTLMGLGDLLNTDRPEHTRIFVPRVIGGIGVSIQSAQVDSQSGRAKASTLPGAGLMVEIGGSLTYRDRWSVALAGMWGYTGYLLKQDTMLHSIAHTGKRAEVRLSWLPHAERFAERQWKFGFAAGLMFQQADELRRQSGAFNAITTVQHAVRPYIAPEFGRWNPNGKDRLELSLRYVINLDGQKAWTSTTDLGQSHAVFTASDNYFSVVTRYHIGFKQKPKPVPAFPASNMPEAERETEVLATLPTRYTHINLRIWDDAEVDGDTVSIEWNDELVLSAVQLEKKPIRLALDLRPGTNRLRVIAHNEGRVPPNTATCTLRRGKGKEQLLIKTTRKKDQVIEFKLE